VLLISVIPYRYYIFRILYHVAAVIIIYFIFGMMTSIAFTALGIVTEFFYCSKPIKYISILVSVAALFFLIYTHTGFTLAKIILKAAHASSYHAIMPLYWHCVIIIGVTIIAANLLSRAEFIDRIFIRLPLMFTQSISLIVLLILISVFYKHYFINPKKYNAQVEYYAGKQQWRKVLALKNKVALNDRISIFELNRALDHEGSMMEKLFIVPQNWGSNTLFLTIELTGNVPSIQATCITIWVILKARNTGPLKHKRIVLMLPEFYSALYNVQYCWVTIPLPASTWLFSDVHLFRANGPKRCPT
jgi:hypothetical protein